MSVSVPIVVLFTILFSCDILLPLNTVQFSSYVCDYVLYYDITKTYLCNFDPP